jgi:hypothetical protein
MGAVSVLEVAYRPEGEWLRFGTVEYRRAGVAAVVK